MFINNSDILNTLANNQKEIIRLMSLLLENQIKLLDAHDKNGFQTKQILKSKNILDRIHWRV